MKLINAQGLETDQAINRIFNGQTINLEMDRMHD